MDKTQLTSRLEEKILLAAFGAAWCAPCRAMAPVIEELRRSYDGRAAIVDMDIDSEKELAKDLMVHSIPTLILFQNGREMRRFVGLQSRAALEDGLDALLESNPGAEGGE